MTDCTNDLMNTSELSDHWLRHCVGRNHCKLSLDDFVNKLPGDCTTPDTRIFIQFGCTLSDEVLQSNQRVLRTLYVLVGALIILFYALYVPYWNRFEKERIRYL